MRSRHSIIAAIAICCAACSDPYAYKISPDPEKWKSDEVLKKNVEQLKPEDKDVLTRYMFRTGMRAALGQLSSTTTVTIHDALDSQRKFEAERAAAEAEEKALAERVKKEREAAIQKMNQILTVALTQLQYHDADWRNGIQDGFSVSFAFHNKSPNGLAGVKGRVRFADMFDDEIQTVNMSVNDAIPAGQTITWQGGIDYNQFKASDQKLRVTPVEKLKVTWIPITYLLADGTRMEAPE